jgi:hypothetical protein
VRPETKRGSSAARAGLGASGTGGLVLADDSYITLLQRYVGEQDLEQVTAAVAKVLQETDPLTLQMGTTGQRATRVISSTLCAALPVAAARQHHRYTTMSGLGALRETTKDGLSVCDDDERAETSGKRGARP